VLAGRGHADGVAYLLDALSSRRSEVRGCAAELTGKHRVAACADALEALVARDEINAVAALQALAKLPDADTRLTRLEGALGDPQLAAKARRLRHKLARETT
jgi:hypothetical protein